MTGKLIPFVAISMEGTTNLSIIFLLFVDI